MAQTNNGFLEPSRLSFELSDSGFLYMTLDGERTFVTPYLAFPLELEDRYVSFFDRDKNELGMLESLEGLDEKSADAVRRELKRRYYCPKIKRILDVDSKMGVSLFKVETEDGKELTLTVKDPYKSTVRITPTRFFIVDRDGARYEIPDTEALDKKSFSKLELYL